MRKVLILCTVALVVAQKATYENYKVFQIATPRQIQVNLLNQFEENGFLFWMLPSAKKLARIMIPPHKLPDFYETMAQIKMSYKVVIPNVQTLIDQTMPPNTSLKFDFRYYHTLDTIYENLDELVEEFPDKVQIIVGGKTYEGRQIKGVKISFKANNPGIFIEGGIHAWEWISPATVMYIVHQLLFSNDQDVRDMAESHDWYIFPLFNPDGYVYTHTTNRLWRKSRKPSGLGCFGTDLNRNWSFKWNGSSHAHPCSYTYPGVAPFSEIETKSMATFIDSIANEIYSYISFHSYSQFLMFPYGYTTAHFDDYDDMYAIGMKATKALKKRYGTKYEVGNIAETIFVAAGGSVDWVKGTYGIPLTFVYELPDNGDRYCFLLPPNKIIPTGKETLDSLVAMFKEAKARGYRAK